MNRRSVLKDFFEKLFKRLFNNLPAKLLSFGVAVLMYAAFQIVSLDTKIFSVPLQVREGGNFSTIEAAPNSVRITVKGEAEEIATIQESDIRAYVDTSTIVRSGTSALPIKLDLIDDLALIDPFDVEVNPHTIELAFEENGFAWVPVEPVFKGTVPNGYEIRSWECTPSDIRITGIKSIVDSITIIYADGVDLNERTESFTIAAGLQSTNTNIRTLADDTVSVYVEIVPQIINRVYNNITIHPYLLPLEFSLVQPMPRASFELSGEKLLLSDYTLRSNVLEADLSGITEVGEHTIPLRINISDDFDIVSMSITEVIVEIVSANLDVPDIESTLPDFIDRFDTFNDRR